MKLFPAIDLYGGKAVRLYKGDYNQMTIYHHDPVAVARDFKDAGAEWIHLVDLEGARDGTTPNLETICAIKEATGLLCEVGGGIRSMETVDRYLSAGVDRVILGTAAISDRKFLQQALRTYGDRIAVGVDLKDGRVAIKGWTETADIPASVFFSELEALGVATVICTDISRDGAMQGTNLSLYRELSCRYRIRFIASGGVSSLADVKALRDMGLYGAIIGKAYYTGAISLKEAIEVTK